ncbi:hypothetical protein PG996_014011 [Apiospora saccharicola]|uniref:BTB domain-containing protein n=1 Tax=Apiospora saccharicola TaxID=335842 RepID=A0ABR1TH69_9PEZI
MPAQKYPVVREEGDGLNGSLWDTGEFSDVKVICQGEQMSLHRAILCRCPWFKENFEILTGSRYEIKLDRFPPDLIRCLVFFIYTTEIQHQRLQLSGLIPRFDHGTFATLYEMGSYFKFPKFKDALIDMGTTSLNQLASSRLSGDRFKKSQIDEILAGVKKAYAGSMYKQAALRSLYVAFFTQHYSKVREVRYFYQAIDPIPVFTKDMKESLGLSDEEWDNAKGDVKCDAKGGKKNGKKDASKGGSKDGVSKGGGSKDSS